MWGSKGRCTLRRDVVTSAAPATLVSRPISQGTATASALRPGRAWSLGSNSSISRLTRLCQTSAYTPRVTALSTGTSRAERGRPTGPNRGCCALAAGGAAGVGGASGSSAWSLLPGGGAGDSSGSTAATAKDQLGTSAAPWCGGSSASVAVAPSDCGPGGTCAVSSAMSSPLWSVSVAPGTGFEPVTLRLTAACSTAELTRKVFALRPQYTERTFVQTVTRDYSR